MVVNTGVTVSAKNRNGMVIRHRQFGLKDSLVVKYNNGTKASFIGPVANKITQI